MADCCAGTILGGRIICGASCRRPSVAFGVALGGAVGVAVPTLSSPDRAAGAVWLPAAEEA
jgi:hypothetical protein